MSNQELKVIEKRIDKLLEKYDEAMSDFKFKESVNLIMEIETELDKLDKNEIKLNSNYFLQ